MKFVSIFTGDSCSVDFGLGSVAKPGWVDGWYSLTIAYRDAGRIMIQTVAEQQSNSQRRRVFFL